GQVPQGRFALHAHIIFKVIHVENSLGRVLHLPHHNRGDLDRVAALVIDLQLLAVEIPRAQRNLETRELLWRSNCATCFGRSQLGFEFGRAAQGTWLAGAIRIKRISPMKSRLSHRSLVCAEEYEDPSFIRLQRKKSD